MVLALPARRMYTVPAKSANTGLWEKTVTITGHKILGKWFKKYLVQVELDPNEIEEIVAEGEKYGTDMSGLRERKNIQIRVRKVDLKTYFVGASCKLTFGFSDSIAQYYHGDYPFSVDIS